MRWACGYDEEQRKHIQNSDIKHISEAPCQTKEMGNTNATTKQPGAVSISGMNRRVLLGSLASIPASCTIMVHASNAGPRTSYISEGGSWVYSIPPYPNRYCSNRKRPLSYLHTSLSTAALSRKRLASAVISRARRRVQVSYLLKEQSCTSISIFTSPSRLALS
jgi:hypothetical protein